MILPTFSLISQAWLVSWSSGLSNSISKAIAFPPSFLSPSNKKKHLYSTLSFWSLIISWEYWFNFLILITGTTLPLAGILNETSDIYSIDFSSSIDSCILESLRSFLESMSFRVFFSVDFRFLTIFYSFLASSKIVDCRGSSCANWGGTYSLPIFCLFIDTDWWTLFLNDTF